MPCLKHTRDGSCTQRDDAALSDLPTRHLFGACHMPGPGAPTCSGTASIGGMAGMRVLMSSGCQYPGRAGRTEPPWEVRMHEMHRRCTRTGA